MVWPSIFEEISSQPHHSARESRDVKMEGIGFPVCGMLSQQRHCKCSKCQPGKWVSKSCFYRHIKEDEAAERKRKRRREEKRHFMHDGVPPDLFPELEGDAKDQPDQPDPSLFLLELASCDARGDVTRDVMRSLMRSFAVNVSPLLPNSEEVPVMSKHATTHHIAYHVTHPTPTPHTTLATTQSF